MFSWLTSWTKSAEPEVADTNSSSMFSFGSKTAHKKQSTHTTRERYTLLKIVIIGDSGVGKTSFIRRFMYNTFYHHYCSTIGADFMVKNIRIGEREFSIQIWDTSGQERFQSISNCYYRGADGILVVYDITNPRSFESLPNWLQEADTKGNTNDNFSPQKVLIGAKVDLAENRKVPAARGREFANQLGIPFVEVSSKEGQNVQEAILLLVESIARNSFGEDLETTTNIIDFDVKKKSFSSVTQHSGDSDDEEAFDEEELEAELTDLMRRSRNSRRSNARSKKPVTKHTKTDVNVMKLNMAKLAEEVELLTGDPVFCGNCGVILSSISKLTKIPRETKSSPALLTAPRVHKKLEDLPRIDPQDATAMWQCEFCDQQNLVELSSEEIPTSKTVEYVLQDAVSSDDATNMIFCIDISGSMCTTYELPDAHQFKGAEKRMAKNDDLRALLGNVGDQFLPGQNPLATMVSRLQCVQAAVEQKILKLAQEYPNKRVGLITFSDEVTVIGDGSQASFTVAGDRLDSWDQIQEAAKGVILTRSVSESKDELIAKLWDLEESGATALGPALQISIAIAGKTPGSHVLVCTDGVANVGLGSLAGVESEVSPYYIELAEQAKLVGVSVSVISLIGSECCLEKLNIVTEQSSGTVERVDPTQLIDQLENLIDRPVLGFATMSLLILHRGLQFRGERIDFNENRSWIVKDLGNVTADSELTVSYQFRSRDQYDLSNVSKVPFQVQLMYFKPNGERVLRISTDEILLTEDRIAAERHADMSVIGTYAAQRAAQLAKDGDYEQAALEARAAQRFMMRNGVDSSKIAAWSSTVNSVDSAIRHERKKPSTQGNSRDATIVAISKTQQAKWGW